MKKFYSKTCTKDISITSHNAGCEKIFSESASGKDNNRTELIKMINSLRANDIVVVYKIDRIARSLKGLIDIVELLKEKNEVDY